MIAKQNKNKKQRQNLLDQIAMDREAKKKAREQQQGGETTTTTAPAPAPSNVAGAVVGAEKKEYAECKIQVRQTDGKSMVHVFRASEQLAAVRLWIEMNRTDANTAFQLMQTFPKKIYTDDDMHRSLAELGLTPASSLVIAKV